MARVHVVGKTKQERRCGKCGDTIPVGAGYRWAAPRSSKAYSAAKKIRCMKTSCAFRASDLTASEHKANLYLAQEDAEDALAVATTAEDVRSALEECEEAVREVAEAMREGAQNIEDGFGHETFASQELNERADAVESWAEEIEQAKAEYEDDDPECEECGETEDGGTHHEFQPKDSNEDETTCTEEGCEAPEEEHHEYLFDLDTSSASDAVGACPE